MQRLQAMPPARGPQLHHLGSRGAHILPPRGITLPCSAACMLDACKGPFPPFHAHMHACILDDPFPHSFAVVIQQLPNPLRDAVCVFYLVLRGLDTVEDDMALKDSIKLPALLSFHKDIYNR